MLSISFSLLQISGAQFQASAMSIRSLNRFGSNTVWASAVLSHGPHFMPAFQARSRSGIQSDAG